MRSNFFHLIHMISQDFPTSIVSRRVPLNFDGVVSSCCHSGNWRTWRHCRVKVNTDESHPTIDYISVRITIPR